MPWQIGIVFALVAGIAGWAWLLFLVLFGGSISELRKVISMFREAGK